MEKNATIQTLWENSGHGTRLEDIQAAYEAGQSFEREACAKIIAAGPFGGTRAGEVAAIRARANTKVSEGENER